MPRLIDVILPASEETAAESAIARWLKTPGDEVALHEPLLEVDTDKVVLEVPSPAAGRLFEILKNEGDRVEPTEVLGRIDTEAGETATAPGPRPVPSPAPPTRVETTDSDVRLSPAVRRALKQHGLEAAQIRGTGRGGRITHHDVTLHLESRGPETSASAAAPAAGARILPHSPMRRKIAAHMVESLLHTAPHVTAVFEADFSAVQRHRRASLEDFRRRGVRLTHTAYLVVAAARALQQTPEVNSTWREEGLELHPDCHIGIATALRREGLVVPVIRKAQELSLFGAASRLQELTERARTGKLTSRDLEGGTFTITNHGVGGSLLATPVIHQPQSAILGVGKIQKRVIVQDDKEGGESLRVAPMAYVTLTIDHRSLDGFLANEFLTRFVAALENWAGRATGEREL